MKVPGLSLLLGLVACCGIAQADSFTFDNGIVSADMEVTVSGNSLIVEVDNTTASGQEVIMAFGADVFNYSALTLNSWTLTGFERAGAGTVADPYVLNSVDLTTEGWSRVSSTNGNFSFVNETIATSGTDLSGGLYNPAYIASDPFLQNNSEPLFTTATLTLNFDGVPEPWYYEYADGDRASPQVRFMGDLGSFNLVPGNGDNPVPEPGTFALFGAALGAAWFIRRRRSA